MPIAQKIFFYIITAIMLLVIINLVRLKKIRENYSLLWLFISLMLLVLVVSYPLLVVVATYFDMTPSAMLMFCGFVGVLMLILQITINITLHSRRIKDMAQKIALLEEKINSLKKK